MVDSDGCWCGVVGKGGGGVRDIGCGVGGGDGGDVSDSSDGGDAVSSERLYNKQSGKWLVIKMMKRTAVRQNATCKSPLPMERREIQFVRIT
jgi:hypothetical protein